MQAQLADARREVGAAEAESPGHRRQLAERQSQLVSRHENMSREWAHDPGSPACSTWMQGLWCRINVPADAIDCYWRTAASKALQKHPTWLLALPDTSSAANKLHSHRFHWEGASPLYTERQWHMHAPDALPAHISDRRSRGFTLCA